MKRNHRSTTSASPLKSFDIEAPSWALPKARLKVKWVSKKTLIYRHLRHFRMIERNMMWLTYSTGWNMEALIVAIKFKSVQMDGNSIEVSGRESRLPSHAEPIMCLRKTTTLTLKLKLTSQLRSVFFPERDETFSASRFNSIVQLFSALWLGNVRMKWYEMRLSGFAWNYAGWGETFGFEVTFLVWWDNSGLGVSLQGKA